MVRSACGGNRRGLVCASIIVLGLVSGCAGSDEAGTSSDEETPPATEADATSDRDSTNDGDGGDEGLAWVPFGPSDPKSPVPGPWPLYNLFADGKCSELEDYLRTDGIGDFGRAMVALCAAAVDGRVDQWDVVEEFAGADSTSLANDCLADVVKDLFDRALAWHEDNPGETPVVQFWRVPDRTECGAQGQDGEPPPDTEEPPPDTEEPPPDTEEPPPDTEEPTETSG
jgi:hypothetical protein